MNSLPGLAVLNPGGRDPDQSFAEGPGVPSERIHPPVNYHGYAACTEGAFYRSTELAARHESVLLLLKSHLEDARRAIEMLKRHGCFIAISFKESGTHQVADLLSRPKRIGIFREIAAAADLCLSSTPDLLPLYASVSKRAVFIPTPYPIEFESWNFQQALENRRGVLIGTREFTVLSRNHLLVLAAAKTLATPITVINTDGKSGLRALEALNFAANRMTVLGRMNYPAYLKLMADNRLVLQFDQSLVPGQVAGDSLLCRVPTVGGNGAVERLAFPDLNGHGRGFDDLSGLAYRLLKEDPFYSSQVANLETLSRERLSFGAVRNALRQLLPGISSGVK
jgi:hypothetical protein